MSKTVLFHPLGEGGHLVPTLHLARKLRSRGDRVLYLAERTLEERVTAEGFTFIPYLDGLYDDTAAEPNLNWYLEKEGHMWADLESKSLDALLKSLDLDLVLYDATRFYTGLAAHRLGIPRAQITTSFPMGREGTIPPIWSDALPGEMDPREIDREWATYEAICWERPYIGPKEPYSREQLYATTTDCGVDIEDIRKGAFGYFIDSDPELVMTSSHLEFPEAPRPPERAYAGPCMEEPSETSWRSARRRSGAPLVYCAFGGQSESHPTLVDFLRALMDFAATDKDVDFVLAAPDGLAAKLTIPDTVERLAWAPQRAILAEADVFITHAGQSSIKEALWADVPMLAHPLAYDQHGNAARIAYHGLGERILKAKPSSEELGEAIFRILRNSEFRETAKRFGALLREETAADTDLSFVDAVLGGLGQDTSAVASRRRAGIIRNIFGYAADGSDSSEKP